MWNIKLPDKLKKRILLLETGTRDGYEDYHGEVYIDNELVTTWHKDKKQGKFIANYNGKFIYRATPLGIGLEVFSIFEKLKASNKCITLKSLKAI